MLNYFSLQDQSWIYWFPILSKRTQSKEKSLIPLSSIHVVFVTPETLFEHYFVHKVFIKDWGL